MIQGHSCDIQLGVGPIEFYVHHMHYSFDVGGKLAFIKYKHKHFRRPILVMTVSLPLVLPSIMKYNVSICIKLGDEIMMIYYALLLYFCNLVAAHNTD